MMPLMKADSRYARQYRQSYWSIGATVVVVVLVNLFIAIWFVMPAHKDYSDVTKQMDERVTSRNSLQQQPSVQQAADSDVSDLLKVLPKRLLLSQLRTTLREAANLTDVLVVKLSQDGADDSTAASTNDAAGDSGTVNADRTGTKFQATVHGDIHSLIAFMTQLHAERQLLAVDAIHFTRLEDNADSDANQLLTQLPKWRAGWPGYSLDLTFRAFVLPESLGHVLNP